LWLVNDVERVTGKVGLKGVFRGQGKFYIQDGRFRKCLLILLFLLHLLAVKKNCFVDMEKMEKRKVENQRISFVDGRNLQDKDAVIESDYQRNSGGFIFGCR